MGEKVLEGIRVADWSVFTAGPLASTWLGALGADVVHIEQAGVGDLTRGLIAQYGIPLSMPGNRNVCFEVLNYNKRSLTVNLRTEGGRAVMHRLVEQSDVFVTNMLLDTIEKLGMDYDTLSKQNPRLIYASTNMFGTRGPERSVPGTDLSGQARAGIMSTSGFHGEPPTPATLGSVDAVSSMSLFSGVLAALLARERTGMGQWVHTSQLQAAMNVLANAQVGMYQVLTNEQRETLPHGGIVRSNPRHKQLNPLTSWYRCKDGKWMMLSSPKLEDWPLVLSVLGRGDLVGDPRCNDLDSIGKNCEELVAILDEAFAARTLEEWAALFLEAGRVPFSPVQDMSELAGDGQVVANNYMFSLRYPEVGELRFAGMPFTLERTPATARAIAPTLGEHTPEILHELGYTWEEIAELCAKGAV